jgi:hypothetical protein
MDLPDAPGHEVFLFALSSNYETFCCHRRAFFPELPNTPELLQLLNF